MVNHENGLRYLTMVRELTKEKEETGVETEVNPEWGGFKHLEDVWMTVLCPVHRDAVWFLQFWIKGPKDNEELEEVVKRVRDRRNKEPGFVEDPFSRRFYEVVGIPSWGTYLEGESSRRHYLNEDEQKRSGFGGMGGDDVGRWRDQTNPMEQRRRFQEQRRAMIGFPPGLGPPPGLRRPPTIPPGLAPPRFLRQQQLFGNTRPDGAVSSPTSWALNHGVEQPGRGGVLLPLHNVGPRDMPVVQQPEASEDAGENMIGEPQPQATRQAFQGTALQWEDPALRLPFTSQPPGVAPPQEIGFGANHTPQLHSPQPSRSFDLADMWQSPSSIQHSR
jgi:hypothetical protein